MRQLIAKDSRALAVNLLTAALAYKFFTDDEQHYSWERGFSERSAVFYTVCAGCIVLLYSSYRGSS